MRKKLLTLLLALSVLLSACPVALAAEGGDEGEEGGARETGFFTAQPHADVDFADMAYEHIESEPILAEVEAVRALLDDAANAKEVEERFYALTDQFMHLATMYNLAYIRQQQDVNDEEAAAEVEHTSELWSVIGDAVNALEQAILESPCSGFLDETLTEEQKEFYRDYERMTDEELALSIEETALTNEYWAASSVAYTAEYEGEEWTDNDAYYAYLAGEMDYDTYNAISLEVAKKTNAALGDIYLRMVDVRQQIARLAGYDNYMEYAYAEIYDRDYTLEEIRPFHAAVKEYIVPLYNALYDLYLDDYYSGAFDALGDTSGDAALDMMEPYIARMSSELLESFTYMRRHGLYDNHVSDTKSGAGFTTMLYEYGAPFYFDTPYADYSALPTAIHEFGHYNHFYWQPTGWEDGSKGHDLAEVHSQGLEVMFSHWYSELLGEEAGAAVLNYQLLNMLWGLFDGARFDELQQFVYTTENVTLQQINQEWRKLQEEYGEVSPDDPRTEMYGWYYVHHTFDSPCYYISYAVSAAGALSFWLEAQEGDYFEALDHYLAFTALDATPSFQESFEIAGLKNPITPEYLEDLSEALWDILDVEARLAAMAPEDLYGDEWFAPEVSALFDAGAIAKDAYNCIYPYDLAVWNDAAELVEQLTESRPETADGEAAITRGEFAGLLAASLGLEDGSASPFSDTDDAAVAALAELGAVNGYADGTFRPDQPISRAEMWVVVYRVLMAMVEQLAAPAA